MKNILVTGASGQLGQSLRQRCAAFPELTLQFCSRQDFDLEQPEQMARFLDQNQVRAVINAAAYTAVDLAEKEPDRAFAINTKGVTDLAQLCAARQIILLHVSTDYVFNGTALKPYLEDHPTAPLGIYGQSKQQGELAVAEINPAHYIVRTSWLYGPYGNNFLKTMLKLADQGKSLTITTEQTGSPTSTLDLADALLKLIEMKAPYGTYHFSNTGQTTWHGFAQEIFTQTQQLDQVQLAETHEYPTFAKRPNYSVLDINKIKRTLQQPIRSWQDALAEVIHQL